MIGYEMIIINHYVVFNSCINALSLYFAKKNTQKNIHNIILKS